MNPTIEKYYDEAKALGMKPYEFDNHIIRHDVFDIEGGHVGRLNMVKYKAAAEHVLSMVKRFKTDS